MAAGYTDVTFEIKDEHVARFRDGIAAHFGYRETIDGEPNPESKAVYAKRKLRQQMVQWVKRAERAEAISAIAEQAEIDINE